MFRKQIFRRDFWLKGKGRYIIASFMIALVLLGVTQVFIPVGDGQENTDRNYWLRLATDAWQYFQPGAGVNAQTGLHSAGLGWPYFTEWDLGTYVQSIIDAHELGILQKTGDWGFDYRIEKILNFLQTRKLASDNVPYSAYDARTGEPCADIRTFSIDEGKLYMALYNLKLLRPDLEQNITNIVKVRQSTTNTDLIPNPNSWLESTDFYCYYIASAFKAFKFVGWDAVPSSIMDTIVAQPNVTANGVKLPVAHICTEPLLLTFFEVNPQEPRFDWLLSQMYLASEARFTATGNYTAFSEGNTGLDNPSYVYEFVVDRDGSTWKVVPSMTPIAYFKVAVGFHAIFNTEYTKNMVNYIKGKLPAPSNGFQDGVAEDGRVVNTNIDRTNGLIISAAKYAINTLSAPSPTPTPTVSPSPSFSPSPLPSPSIIPTSSPTPSYSSSPTYNPYPSESSTPTVAPSPTSSPSSSPSPSFSLSPTSSPSPSLSPLETPTSSPTSSPSLSPNTSLSKSSSPTTNNSTTWSAETVVIVVFAVAGCSFLASLLLIRFRAHSTTKYAQKHMPETVNDA
jgi:hypothetical protein